MAPPRRPRPSWRQLMVAYRLGHRHLGTRLTHMLGVPLTVLSVPMLLVSIRLAVGLLVVGWTLQLMGHLLFERNDPHCLADRRNQAVGVLWAGMEWARVLNRRRGNRRLR